MRSVELLAPAKDAITGRAAIDHGADAVYIGAQRFGARAAATNSIEDIRELTTYAHTFGAKVYVTINTLLYDNELNEAQEMICALDEIPVDGILVQDERVAEMVKKTAHLELHSSTQMDNRTADDVKARAKEGYKRVVVARELPISEIADIHAQVPNIEIEAFIHGALCVAYSGKCYASEYCFGRSANRGECAQFCRLPFTLTDAEGNIIVTDKHLLSLKDMNRSEHIEALLDAGVTSLKIEGRLKDVNYVKNVTAAYNNILNSIIARRPQDYKRVAEGKCYYTFTPDLSKTFNRTYTSYFANGGREHIASINTPKAVGQRIGIMEAIDSRTITLKTNEKISNGDGLCFFDNQGKLQGFRVNKVSEKRIFPHIMPQGTRVGAEVFRNNDVAFNKILEQSNNPRKIPVTIAINASPSGFTITAEAAKAVTYSFNCEHTAAQTPQHENIARVLSKLGDTHFVCEKVKIPEDFSFFIPASVLTAARRQLMTML